MLEETRKRPWLWILGAVFTTFLVLFLAFYLAMSLIVNKIHDPMYRIKKLEKIIAKQKFQLDNFEDRMMENPFQPKMRPMLVNLTRENSEYRVIVDLKPFDNDPSGINVSLNGNVLTINGELDKKFHDNEKIINFTQAYYLDEKLEMDKMTKEQKGDKYIITIPVDD